MKVEARPGVGLTHLRTSAESFLSILLSIIFVLPSSGITLPATAAAGPAREDGHGSAVPLHKDKKVKQDAALNVLPITELSADEAILHALNRLAHGPRPGDVERVRQMGLAKWIDQQLSPNSIDDKALEARLQDYPTLKLSTAKLIDEYPQSKPAEKQAKNQAQARVQEEQRRADVAAAVIKKDMQTSQGQPKN